MRIGIVINSSWNVHNFRAGLIHSLLNDGHQVVAIAPDDGYADKLRAMGCQYEHVMMENKGTNPLADLQLTHRLYRLYKTLKPDILLHYTIKPNIYGTLAAAMLGIPCINNVTGLGTVFIRKSLSASLAKILYRISFRYPGTVFFQNEDDRHLFVSTGLVKASVTHVLPGSGVDVQHFSPRQASDKRADASFRFLLVARLLYDKGIMEYVEAIRLLKARGIEASYQLLGKIDPEKGLGVPYEQVAEWVEEELLEYCGEVDNVIPFMEQADCVLLPSYREGTPRTLLEAASLGKPIIATDVPGCRETVVHGHNGFLCQVKNPVSLAESMQAMTQLAPDMLRQMGQNSRKLAVSKFDQKIVIAKYRSAIAQLTEKKSARNRQFATV